MMMTFMEWGIFNISIANTAAGKPGENIFAAIMQESLGAMILVQFYLM